MKISIAISILFLALGNLWGDSIFKGRIISIMDQGQAALISCDPEPKIIGGFTPDPYSIVLVRGKFSSYVDGNRVKVIGVGSGTYQYTTVLGALATISAFNARYLIPLQNPPLGNE